MVLAVVRLALTEHRVQNRHVEAEDPFDLRGAPSDGSGIGVFRR